MGTVVALPGVELDLPIQIDPGKIVVSGSAEYPASEWKNALLYFLKGLWKGAGEITRKPHIRFDNVTLRVQTMTGDYYAYGMFPDPRVPTSFNNGEILTVGSHRLEVQDALTQLIYNDYLKMVHLKLKGDQWFALWKKEDGLYGCTGKVTRFTT